jgi:hypothetical protein
MKKTTKKKLSLSKETIKMLEENKLPEAVGGGPSALGGPTGCYTWCGCPDTR